MNRRHRRRGGRGILLAVAGLVGAVAPVSPASATPGTTVKVSVASDGTMANAATGSLSQGATPALSADGRFVAWSSHASNLLGLGGDTNAVEDVFVRDRDTDANGVLDEAGGVATTRVSVGRSGAEANGASFRPSISADGRFVAFTSAASNLVAGDTNGAEDVFVYDRVARTTELVSVDSLGNQSPVGASFNPAISANGKVVAFVSAAPTLVLGDTNDKPDVFVRDRAAATTVRVSVKSDGAEANGASADPAISADGRYVAFASDATNLVEADTNASRDVFVRDRDADGDGLFDMPGAATTERVSLSAAGVQGSGASHQPAISADGDRVAFTSQAPDLVEGDANAASDVFVRHRRARTTTRASVASDGTEAEGRTCRSDPRACTKYPAVSADGRMVAFTSGATNLVAGDTNARVDVFVHDTASGATTVESVAGDGTQANGTSYASTLAANGFIVAFWSGASNLAPGGTTGGGQVFVHAWPRPGATRLGFTPRSTRSGPYGDAVVVEARLADANATPLSAAQVVFQLDVPGSALTASATTGADGVASAPLTLAAPAGAYPLRVRYGAGAGFDGAEATTTFTIEREATLASFTLASATGGQYSDPVVLEGRLGDDEGNPVPGATVAFELAEPGSSRLLGSAVTDAGGLASITTTLSEAPGTYQLVLHYAGEESTYHPAQASVSFLVDKDASLASLTVSGAPGRRVLVARLFDADTPTPGLAGRSLRFFANGTAIGTATTGPDGTARLTVPAKYQKGKHRFEVVFDGDDYYGGSSASAST